MGEKDALYFGYGLCDSSTIEANIDQHESKPNVLTEEHPKAACKIIKLSRGKRTSNNGNSYGITKGLF